LLPNTCKLEYNRYEFELYIVVNEYIRSEPNYKEVIEYIYGVVIKYIKSTRRESYKPKAINFFKKIFELGNYNNCEDEKVSFISLHITLLFVRILSTSWYDNDVNKNITLQDFAEYTSEDITSIIDINKNITVIQLMNHLVDELERTYTILHLTKFIQICDFDRGSIECFLFKILKLIENSTNGDRFLSTKIITKAPSHLGSKPSNFSVVYSKLDKNKPGVITFGIHFCPPIYFWKNSYGVSVTSFIFHTKKAIAKNNTKKASVFNDSYADTLKRTSSVKFYVDYDLLAYTNNICIKFLEVLKNEEIALNNLYREHVEKNKQSIQNYLDLLEGDYPNNWINKQRFNIEFLKKRRIGSKNLKALEAILEEKIKSITKKMVDDPNYLNHEILKTKKRLKNLSTSIEVFEESLDLITNKLFTKLNNIDQLKLTRAQNTFSKIISNTIHNDINNTFVGSGIDNTRAVPNDETSLRFIKSTTGYKGLVDKVEVKCVAEKYKLEQELYESYKKTTVLLLARIQKHNSYIALVNLFIDYYNFIKKYNIDYVYFSTFGDFRGRVYYASSVSPQANSLFRFIYYFGVQENIPSIIIPNFVQKNAKLLKIFDDELLDIRLVHVLFSIGILFKDSTLIKNPECIDLCEIVLTGITKYKEFKENSTRAIKIKQFNDIKKILELNYYINIIKSLNSTSVKNYYIIKDTTASFAQHVGIACGFNEDSLKYVNLDNTDYMYDTYRIIINNLKKYLKTYKPKKDTTSTSLLLESIEYFDRKLLKDTIMTINYGIGIHKAFKNFKILLQDLPNNYFSDN
jgi:hypothetical protein